MSWWSLSIWLCLGSSGRTDALTPAGRTLVDRISHHLASSKVGDWVTYEMRGGSQQRFYWRLAVVGEELSSTGAAAVWVEMEMAQHPEFTAPLTQMRMLVSMEGHAERIYRLIVALGHDQLQEVTTDALDKLLEAERRQEERSGSPLEEDEAAVRVGRESRLMTFAGTIAAVPVEVLNRGVVVQRLWISGEVPVLHLAKLEIPGIHQSIEMRAFGGGAKPRIPIPDPTVPQIHLETKQGSATTYSVEVP